MTTLRTYKFYTKDRPLPNDLVVGRVIQISDTKITLQLLEYEYITYAVMQPYSKLNLNVKLYEHLVVKVLDTNSDIIVYTCALREEKYLELYDNLYQIQKILINVYDTEYKDNANFNEFLDFFMRVPLDLYGCDEFCRLFSTDLYSLYMNLTNLTINSTTNSSDEHETICDQVHSYIYSEEDIPSIIKAINKCTN